MRAVHGAAALSALLMGVGMGCADGISPPTFVALEGPFRATSFDGRALPQPVRVLVYENQEGGLDTLTYILTEWTWEFFDFVDDPESWDRVDLIQEQFTVGPEADTFTRQAHWRYRSTLDSLWLRFVDGVFDSVFWRVSWDPFDAAFEHRTVLYDEPYLYLARFERPPP